MEDRYTPDLVDRVDEGMRIGGRVGKVGGALGSLALGYVLGKAFNEDLDFTNNIAMQWLLYGAAATLASIPSVPVGHYAGMGLGALVGAGYHVLTKIGKGKIGKSLKKINSRAFEDTRVSEVMGNEEL